ncbi:site-2 protease family protein [Sphingomonas sp. CJ20]
MKMLATALFLVCMIAVHGSLARHFHGDSGAVVRVLIVLVLSFIVTLVHELGHAAAVLAVRGHVTSIVVLPFAYRVGSGKLELARRMKNREVGGYVAFRIDAINARRKHAIVAAAGPAANVVLALALGVVIAALPESGIPASHDGVLPSAEVLRAWAADTAWRRALEPLLAAMAALSAGVALTNLVPFRGSDGHAILRALWPQRFRAA